VTTPPSPPSLPATRQGDGVLAVTVGTIAWAVALVVLLAAHAWVTRHHATWWTATAAVGLVFGIGGTWWVRRRRARYQAAGRSASGQGESG